MYSIVFIFFCLALPCLALPCLALPCLALPCLAVPCSLAWTKECDRSLLHYSTVTFLFITSVQFVRALYVCIHMCISFLILKNKTFYTFLILIGYLFWDKNCQKRMKLHAIAGGKNLLPLCYILLSAWYVLTPLDVRSCSSEWVHEIMNEGLILALNCPL